MSDGDSSPVPVQIVLNKSKDLVRIEFDTGNSFEYEAEFLRVYSPSAEVRGHGNEPRKTPPGKQLVKITAIEQVGNYAVKFVFDDRHDSGIYSWSYLYEIGADKEALWSRYLEELDEAGLSRS